jgi:hypothetical protein
MTFDTEPRLDNSIEHSGTPAPLPEVQPAGALGSWCRAGATRGAIAPQGREP